jgi:hypothetical protein
MTRTTGSVRSVSFVVACVLNFAGRPPRLTILPVPPR